MKVDDATANSNRPRPEINQSILNPFNIQFDDCKSQTIPSSPTKKPIEGNGVMKMETPSIDIDILLNADK